VPSILKASTLQLGSQVAAALRQQGLESSNLILGIDFTKSNEWTGTLKKMQPALVFQMMSCPSCCCSRFTLV